MIVLIFGARSPATTHYVDLNSSNPTPPFLDWSTAATNIQDAVDASVDGDTVLVTNGVYATGGREIYSTLTNRVAINKALAVQSVNGPALTLIDGGGAVRPVYMTNAATLSGFTLTNGHTASVVNDLVGSGGGVWCESTNATITNCVIGGNVAYWQGGGAYAGTLINSLLITNRSSANGAGAIGATLDGCVITSNLGNDGGGGVSACLVNNSLIIYNQGQFGGGANASVLNNCTMVGNSAFQMGGGDYQGVLNNCIVYDNSAASGGSNYSGSTISFSCTAPLPVSGSNNVASPPLFVNLSGGDFHLLSNSPCLNVGNNAAVVGTTDLDGNPRIVADVVDMGAYEYQSIVPLTVAIQVATTNIALDYSLNFQAVIQGGNPDILYWDFGDGTFVSNQLTPSHAWTAPGLYTVIATVSNAFTPGGATASVSVLVNSTGVVYVNVNGNNPVAPYSSWDTAATNIQDAIDAAFDGSLVLVTNGVYAVGGRTANGFALTNRVITYHLVTLESVNGPAATTIEGYTPATTNGPSAVRCVLLSSNTALIGFTIAGGATLASGDAVNELSGGGIWCAAGNSVVSNCVVVSNACASLGGGTFQGTLLNCTVASNFSRNSGGGSSSSAMSNCVVTGNLAIGSGGGSYSSTLNNCTVLGNLAFVSGGGAYSGTLYNCSVSSNSAINPNPFIMTSGGGVASATVVNCLITGNSASNGGGVNSGTIVNSAIFDNTALTGGGVYGGSATNCAIVGNVATAVGSVAGGLYVCSAANCIVYFNTSGNPNFNNYQNGSQVLDHCCTFPMPSSGTGNITNDPALASVQHISLNSPCRGAGNAAVTTGVDIDGEPWADPPSIGCDELYPGTLTNTPVITILASYTNVPVGYSNNFFASISGPVDGSIWDFGDGTRATNAPLISHIWPALGTYPVTLYAFNDSYPSGLAAVLTINYYIPPTLYVMTNSKTPIAPYDSWSKAATNIQNAIDVAYTNDLILVSNGVYNNGSRTNTDGSTNRVLVWQPLMIQSVNGPAVTRIDGGGTMRCVYLTNGAGLAGFAISNGFSGNGGGILCASSNNVVSSCLVVSNHAGNGGGMFLGTATNCSFTRNSTPANGAAAYESTLENCVVGPLNSGFGSVANCVITNCLIASNGLGVSGGTVFNSLITSNLADAAMNSTLVGCTLSMNGPYNGAVVYNSKLTNCVLTRNLPSADGGGVAGLSTLVNCTIVSNSIPVSIIGTLVIMENCVSYYNGLTNGGNSTVGNHLTNCCVYPLPPSGVGNFTNAPLFVNLTGGDFHLQSTSPCINAGNNTFVAVGTDLDGNPRIEGGTVDVGAYEYQTPTSVLSYAWAQQYGIPTDGSADFADPDGDGMNNWQEWIAGTNPTNALSALELLPPVLTNSAGVTITWQSVTNQTYYLERATDIGSTPAFSPIQSNIVGQAGFTSFIDTTATNSNAYFYRVGVQQPYANVFN